MSWNYTYTPALWVPLGTVLLMLTLGVYSGRRRGAPGARPFSLALLFAALWSAGSLLELAAVDLSTKIFWLKSQAIWQQPAATAITLFLLDYTWPGRWLTRRNLLLLSIVPLLTALFIMTDHIHHLMWRGFILNTAVTPLLAPGSWIAIAYGYGFVLINVIVLVWLFLHFPQHRSFAMLILVGQLGNRIVYLLDKSYVLHSYLPLDVFGIGFAYLMYAIALFRFRVLNPEDLARQSVIAQMRDGMLVLDLQNGVVSMNPAAVTILRLPEKLVRGRPVGELLPSYRDAEEGGSGESEISLRRGAETRNYLLSASMLQDWRGQEAGRLLLLRDITEQKQAQAQLVAQQRSLAMLQEREHLARELHDGIGQVLGYVKMQAQAARDRLAQNNTEAVDRQLAQLVAIAQDAHADVREYIMATKNESAGHAGLLTTLQHYLQRFSEHYPLRTEMIAPADWSDDILEPPVAAQLLRIIQEALSNSRKHAQAQCVQVHLEVKEACALIVVRDDGAGFDPQTLPEDPSDHYGLQFMRERAEQIGGHLAIDSHPGGGTRVLIEVPRNRARRRD